MMETKPIPALYCCYLLRSTKYHGSLYVGSTPNPRRRLAQHNGDSKGGAVRTAQSKLRPWEMTCVVTGFPSKIAALQFEWAWQNTHITKRIADAERITARETKVKTSKSGRTRTRPARPRPSLTGKISNLHLLLRVPSFARWPLSVRFFCEDVYLLWQRWNERVDGKIREGVNVVLDLAEPGQPADGDRDQMTTQAEGNRKREALGKGGVTGLDVGYGAIKDHVEKSNFLLADNEVVICAVCSIELGPQRQTAVVCPHEGCRSASHLHCLARTFLAEEGHQSSLLIPLSGTCPACKKVTVWVDLVKEMSLRARGKSEVALLMRRPKAPKARLLQSVSTPGTAMPVTEVDREIPGEPDDDQLDDNWQPEGVGDDDAASVTSAPSVISAAEHTNELADSQASSRRLPVVIDDSEWDDAQILD